MIALTPIVFESGKLFGRKEIMLKYLDGNKVYLIVLEHNQKRKMVVDINHPTIYSEVKSGWPIPPKRITTDIVPERIVYGRWFSEHSQDVRSGELTYTYYPMEVLRARKAGRKPRDFQAEFLNQLTYQQWKSIVAKGIGALGITQQWYDTELQRAQAIRDANQAELDKGYHPFVKADVDQSRVVKYFLTFNGKMKEFVQGLQQLGWDARGLEAQNYVSEGFGVENLEDFISNKSRGEDPT